MCTVHVRKQALNQCCAAGHRVNNKPKHCSVSYTEARAVRAFAVPVALALKTRRVLVDQAGWSSLSHIYFKVAACCVGARLLQNKWAT